MFYLSNYFNYSIEEKVKTFQNLVRSSVKSRSNLIISLHFSLLHLYIPLSILFKTKVSFMFKCPIGFLQWFFYVNNVLCYVNIFPALHNIHIQLKSFYFVESSSRAGARAGLYIFDVYVCMFICIKQRTTSLSFSLWLIFRITFLGVLLKICLQCLWIIHWSIGWSKAVLLGCKKI